MPNSSTITKAKKNRNSTLFHTYSADILNYGKIKLRQAIEEIITRYIAPLLQKKTEIIAVDFGCGKMPYRELFLPLVSKYIGADLKGNPLANVLIETETSRTDLATASADLVISTQVLEHVESPTFYLSEACRLLKPQGLLLLSTHGFYPYHGQTDYWRWTGSGLRKLLENRGWEIIEVIGIIGFAAASLRLFLYAASPKVPSFLRGTFTLFMARLIATVDQFYSPESRQENASIYLILARRPSNIS